MCNHPSLLPHLNIDLSNVDSFDISELLEENQLDHYAESVISELKSAQEKECPVSYFCS